MNTTPNRGARVVVELDHEAETALDRARRDVRLSRPSYVRSIVAKHLRELGALASAIQGDSR